MRELFLALLAAQRGYGYEIGQALEDQTVALEPPNGHGSAADLLLGGDSGSMEPVEQLTNPGPTADLRGR